MSKHALLPIDITSKIFQLSSSDHMGFFKQISVSVSEKMEWKFFWNYRKDFKKVPKTFLISLYPSKL